MKCPVMITVWKQLNFDAKIIVELYIGLRGLNIRKATARINDTNYFKIACHKWEGGLAKLLIKQVLSSFVQFFTSYRMMISQYVVQPLVWALYINPS